MKKKKKSLKGCMINPFTGRAIKVGGITHMKIKKGIYKKKKKVKKIKKPESIKYKINKGNWDTTL